MNIYRELDAIDNEEGISNFQQKLEDRFGPLPEQSIELLKIVKLRWIAAGLAIEKIVLKNGVLIAWFVSDQKSPFYQSETFSKMLLYIQKNPKALKMKEGKNKLNLTISNIHSVYEAINVLGKINDSVSPNL